MQNKLSTIRAEDELRTIYYIYSEFKLSYAFEKIKYLNQEVFMQVSYTQDYLWLQ